MKMFAVLSYDATGTITSVKYGQAYAHSDTEPGELKVQTAEPVKSLLENFCVIDHSLSRRTSWDISPVVKLENRVLRVSGLIEGSCVTIRGTSGISRRVLENFVSEGEELAVRVDLPCSLSITVDAAGKQKLTFSVGG